MPINLYKSLASMPEGIKMIEDSGHVQEFKQILSNPDVETLPKRAALWALANIGQSEDGFELLSKFGLIELIIDIAQNAEQFSLRGACIYIMGLLSETYRGITALKQHDWERSNSNLPICLPKNISILFKIKPVKFHGGIISYPEIFEKFRTAQ